MRRQAPNPENIVTFATERQIHAMNKNRYREQLEAHHIKPTANRLIVMNALATSLQPMSLSELEQRIQTIDKSNIFRTLNTFKKHHLVHVIDGIEGARYELCHSHDLHKDEDLHPHFYCEECQQTFCLDNMDIPHIDLPDGYMGYSVNIMVKGICPKCRK